MPFKRVFICIGVIAFASSAAPALGGETPGDGVVVFVNASSNTVTVSVDGTTACTIRPGATCSTVLPDDDFRHLVHGDIGSGQTWDDKVEFGGCFGNGTMTYTFTDQHVPFECKK